MNLEILNLLKLTFITLKSNKIYDAIYILSLYVRIIMML